MVCSPIWFKKLWFIGEKPHKAPPSIPSRGGEGEEIRLLPLAVSAIAGRFQKFSTYELQIFALIEVAELLTFGYQVAWSLTKPVKVSLSFCTALAFAELLATSFISITQPKLLATPTPNSSPTLINVPYGEDPQQKLDFWKALSDKPTPLVFFMHGGGWVYDDKSWPDVRQYLAAGISVVSIQYRYTTEAQIAGVKPPVKWPTPALQLAA